MTEDFFSSLTLDEPDNLFHVFVLFVWLFYRFVALMNFSDLHQQHFFVTSC